jgi:hypothetical protein
MQRLAALILLGALFVPATVQLFSERTQISASEKRARAPLPAWPRRPHEWRAFPADVDRYARDHFGLREPLATGWSLAKYALRNTPRVAVGREGWLYFPQYWELKYGAGDCRALAEEVRSLGGRLDRLAAYASAHGVAVLVAVAPDKETIYPEHLSDPAPVRCDLLAELQHSLDGKRARTADLRAALEAAKAREQVYFRTDSHWNDVGGWSAAATLLEGLCASGSRCVKLPQPSLSTKTASGDLAGLIGLASVLTERTQAIDVPAAKRAGRTLVVIGDSFAKSILRFLAAEESVGEVTFLDDSEDRIDVRPILVSKPDAILVVIVERYLYDPKLVQAIAADF